MSRAERAAVDNAAAAAIPAFTVATAPLFGAVVLGLPIGDQDMGWDLYRVIHSGAEHIWSSGVVRDAFTTDSEEN